MDGGAAAVTDQSAGTVAHLRAGEHGRVFVELEIVGVVVRDAASERWRGLPWFGTHKLAAFDWGTSAAPPSEASFELANEVVVALGQADDVDSGEVGFREREALGVDRDRPKNRPGMVFGSEREHFGLVIVNEVPVDERVSLRIVVEWRTSPSPASKRSSLGPVQVVPKNVEHEGQLRVRSIGCPEGVQLGEAPGAVEPLCGMDEVRRAPPESTYELPVLGLEDLVTVLPEDQTGPLNLR